MLAPLRRLYHFLVRSTVSFVVLFPMWVRYVMSWEYQRAFDEKYPKEHWSALHTRYAARFYKLAGWMRGGMIKVGQIISTRVDILPREWTDGLAKLQDKVQPLPWETLRPHLVRTYGRDPEELFTSIETEPVAAASFGQVHRAVTLDGQEVALKIKYPDIEMKLSVDLLVFGAAVRLFNVFLPKIELAAIYQEMSRALFTELDYEQEANFTRIVHANFENTEGTTVPAVIDELTTKDVICTTWFSGTKITDPSILEDPRLDREALLKQVLSTWIQMMYSDGVFQSDPHPGNLLVRIEEEGPILCVVDFGQVKIMPRSFHQKLVRSVMAFATRDVPSFTESLVDLGLMRRAHIPVVQPIVAHLLKRYENFDPKKLDIKQVRADIKHAIDTLEDIVIPQELVLYGRTISLLSGLGRQILPGENALAIARPMIVKALMSGGPPERPRAAVAAE